MINPPARGGASSAIYQLGRELRRTHTDQAGMSRGKEGINLRTGYQIHALPPLAERALLSLISGNIAGDSCTDIKSIGRILAGR